MHGNSLPFLYATSTGKSSKVYLGETAAPFSRKQFFSGHFWAHIQKLFAAGFADQPFVLCIWHTGHKSW
jgi:hypothetical protein